MEQSKKLEMYKKSIFMKTDVIKMNWINPITASVLIIFMAISFALRVSQVTNDLLFVLFIILSTLISASIHIADQGEKAVVLRMDKFKGPIRHMKIISIKNS